MRLSGFGVLLGGLILSACHASVWRQQRIAAEHARQNLPQIRRLDGQAASVTQTFEIDEKTGRSKVSLVLRLDYFPPTQNGQTAVPVCLAPLDAQFELGTVGCEGQPESTRSLFAKNVEQDCYTSSQDEKRSASDALILPACKRGVVNLHGFEPSLRLDQEVRDSGA